MGLFVFFLQRIPLFVLIVFPLCVPFSRGFWRSAVAVHYIYTASCHHDTVEYYPLAKHTTPKNREKSSAFSTDCTNCRTRGEEDWNKREETSALFPKTRFDAKNDFWQKNYRLLKFNCLWCSELGPEYLFEESLHNMRFRGGLTFLKIVVWNPPKISRKKK